MRWPKNPLYTRHLQKAVLQTSIIVVVLTLIGLAALATPSLVQAQSKPIQMQVEAGFEGFYRANQWTPLLVSLSNSGPDVTGELRVTGGSNNGLASNGYVTRVDLPSKSSKQVWLNVRLVEFASSVQVDFVTDAGVSATVTRPVRLVTNRDLLVSVVTDSPRGAVDLQRGRNGVNDIVQTNWRIDNIPRSAEGLGGLDVLVLTDVDSGTLTADQRSAISDWVVAGGHLVVTGGSNWQRTQAGVTELLPITASQTTTLTGVPALAQFAGTETGSENNPANNPLRGDAPIVVVQGTLVTGAQTLAAESGLPLLARRTLGEGWVDYLAIDPGAEPFQSWRERGQFWASVLFAPAQRPSWSYGITDLDTARQAADLIKGLRLPDVLQLVLFFSAYIAAIGPLNYLVLRFLKRPEWAWITIPIIILVTSVFLYTTGFSLRGTAATVNRLSLVQVWDGAARARVSSVVGLLAPRRGIYTMEIKGGLSIQPLNDAVTTLNPSATGSIVGQGATYVVRDVPVDAGTTAAFAVEGYVAAPLVEGRATLVFGEPRDANSPTTFSKIKGTITNNSGLVLQGAVILGLGGVQEIGTLAVGDQRDFDFLVNYVSAAPQLVGNATPGVFELSSGFSGSGTGRDRSIVDILGQPSLDVAIAGANLESTLADQEAFRRSIFLRSVMQDFAQSGGRGAEVYLAGWTTSSPFEIGLNGTSFTPEDTTLWIFRLPVTFEAAKPASLLELPNGLMTWTLAPESTQRDAATTSLQLRTGETAIFVFRPLVDVIAVEGLRLTIAASYNSIATDTKISLWNWSEKRWEQVPLKGSAVYLDVPIVDVGRFLSATNTVQLKVEPSATNASVLYLDSFDVTIQGRMR